MGGGLCLLGAALLFVFLLLWGSGHVPRLHGHCLLAPKLSFGQQEEHGLEHALMVLIPTQTLWGHEIIPCHTPPSTIKYLGSDYIALDLIE